MQTNIITGAAVNIEFRWTPAVLDAMTGRVGASCVPFGADNAFELFVSWTTDAENPCFRWSITDADGSELDHGDGDWRVCMDRFKRMILTQGKI